MLAPLLSSGPPNLSVRKRLRGRSQATLRCAGSAEKLARDEAKRNRLAEISWKRGQYRGN